MEVYGQLMGEVSGELVCTVESNGDTLVKREAVELRQGEKTLVYSGTFDKPSAVQVYVYPKDDDKQKAAVGFVVDRFLGTSYWTVLLFFAGALAGFRNIFVLAREVYGEKKDGEK